MKNLLNIKFHNQQAGVSLIELMIAMIIGLILTAGAIQIFLGTKTTYRLETALSRMQETGRFIIDVMAQDIRMAGFNGCASRGTIEVSVIARSPSPIDIGDPANGIRGYDYDSGSNWNPAKEPTVTGGILTDNTLSPVLNGPDILTVNRANECGAPVVNDNGSATLLVHAPNTCSFVQGEPLIITDCKTAHVFQVQSTPSNNPPTATLTHPTSLNTGNFFGKTYGPDAQVFKVRSVTYFIANGNSGEPALWQSLWTSNGDTNLNAPGSANSDFTTFELADGVEDIQVLYGVDTGGNEYANDYVTADAVTDWANVKSVRINLLLRSDDRITDEPRSITFNGNTINDGAGADRRLRMVYSTTVTLRNRLP